MHKIIYTIILCVCVSLSTTTVILPSDKRIHYRGRIAIDSQLVLYDWSGISFTLCFTNTTTLPKILLREVGNFYNVRIQTENVPTQEFILKTTNDSQIKKYELVRTISLDRSKTYILQIEKRTEASFGVVQFGGYEFSEPVVILEQPKSTKKKIEFFGASVVCGFGVEGKPPCNFTPDTENNYFSFAQIAARELNADANIVCWSGKGMVRNNGDRNQTSTKPMPYFYDKAVANMDSAKWNFSDYIPDAVVILLGANDFWSKPYPTQEQFSSGYNNFIDRVKTIYGKQVHVVCVCGIGHLPYIQEIVEQRKDPTVVYLNIENILKDDDWGCSGHPNINGSKKIGQKVVEVLKPLL